jgi:hypothetical protein
MDTQPVLDPPFDILDLPKSKSSFPRLAFTQRAITSVSDSFADLAKALDLLGNMSGYLSENKAQLALWQHEVANVKVMLPVTYQLFLFFRSNQFHGDADQLHVMGNTTRMACLLYLTLVKQRFSGTKVGISKYASKLSKLLKERPIDWPTSLRPFGLWVNVVLATATIQNEIESEIRAAEIRSLMKSMGLTWIVALILIKGILWTEGLADEELSILEHLISSTRSLHQ